MELFEKAKYLLKGHKFYKKYCQTSINDWRYRIRSLKYYIRLYHWKPDKDIKGNTVFFIIDPAISHPGLSDRMKAIVGTYYIAKENGFDFKIIFDTPFLLPHYLENVSDKNNWIANWNELSYSLKNSRIFAYNGGGKIPTLNKNIKQYHVYSYIGYNILATNKIADFRKVWGDLFKQLFKPAPILADALNRIRLEENKFISLHFRFVNALEPFEENQFNFLSDMEKENLIQRCLKAIQSVTNQYPEKQIVVFSDSNLFLDRVKQELPVIVLEGKTGHISFKHAEDIILKTFVDFFVMARSEKVIRILSKEMYVSAFSYYAALSGQKECEDVWI